MNPLLLTHKLCCNGCECTGLSVLMHTLLFLCVLNYLLVLFIAELFSTAALLLHWWSAKASERVPRASWSTSHLVCRVLYFCLCPGQQEQTQDGELPGVTAVHLIIDCTELHAKTLFIKPHCVLVKLPPSLSLSLCYLKITINHVFPLPATQPHTRIKVEPTKVRHLSLQHKQVSSILNGGTGSDR